MLLFSSKDVKTVAEIKKVCNFVTLWKCTGLQKWGWNQWQKYLRVHMFWKENKMGRIVHKTTEKHANTEFPVIIFVSFQTMWKMAALKSKWTFFVLFCFLSGIYFPETWVWPPFIKAVKLRSCHSLDLLTLQQIFLVF